MRTTHLAAMEADKMMVVYSAQRNGYVVVGVARGWALNSHGL